MKAKKDALNQQRRESTFQRYNTFRQKYGTENFTTIELAQQYAKLKMDWWGGNLVFLGIDTEADGTFSPKFNVFD